MVIGYIITIFVGFIPFIISLVRLKRMKRMRNEGVQTTAIVKAIYGRSLRGMNRVLIEFSLETGQLVSQEIIVGGVPYEEGDRLPLVYEKDNPSENMLDSGKKYYVVVVVAFLLGIFAIGACYLIQRSIEKGEI